jgi:C4-dicarboxylate transporter DctM subunit
MTVAAILGFALLLALGVPIAFAIGSAAAVALAAGGIPLSVVPQRLFGVMDSFILLSIPLFILAGELMNGAGIAVRLIRLAETIVGRFRGGVGMVVVSSEYMFSGISGSTIADTAAIGSTMIPALQRNGYTAEKATGIVCGACAMGMLVPPSISMVLYGGMTGVSIGALFAAGFLPALVTAAVMMVQLHIEARRRGIPPGKSASLGEVGRAARDAVWALLMPLIIFGGILGGIFTPTEAAVVAVVYALLVDRLVYREIDLAKLQVIAMNTVRSTGVVMLMIACSSIFAWYLTIQDIPESLARILIAMKLGPQGVLVIVVLVFLALGTIMDEGAAMIMVVPLLLPIMRATGVEPLVAGIVIVASIGMGMFLPPIGPGLFVGASVARVPIDRAAWAMAPYMAVVLVCTLLMIFVPGVITVLPRALGLS